jgi:Cu(I)/Ag(I) efflux system membrane fusion protein
MNDDQIRFVEKSGKVQPRISLSAPLSGVVTELMAREGMTVATGAPLFRINGVSTIWANAEIPESQAALVRPGAGVEARSTALPGTVLNGVVQVLLPEVNPGTRTLKARIELANPRGELVPGMAVTVALAANAAPGLMVPTEALIRTGTRTVVMLDDGGGRFRPADVEIGAEANGQTEIRRGLEAGQKIVVSGQFLIDSESSLRATTTRMEGMPKAPLSPAIEHGGQAKIEAIGKDAVTLSHGPIASLQWPAMTMDFAAPPGDLPAGLKPGLSVTFAFTMNKDGQPVLTRIEPGGQGAPNTATGGMGAAGKKP